jgi:hypothetical protein
MNAGRMNNSLFGWMTLALATAIALAAAPVARADSPDREGRYQQHNLVTDGFVTPADNTDSVHLKNPWGIAFNQFGPVWIADNGSGFSTVYNGAGALLLTVTIPAAAGGNPTGIVFNGSSGFNVAGAGTPATFIFATEDGFIAAWNKAVDPANAVVKTTNTTGAVYKGLALSAGGNGSLLYATDFHNNRIDVWDNTFTQVTTLAAGAFTDPSLPKGFAPFGIQAINGNLYVTYAKQDADAHDDVQGKGLGYVDVYDPNGKFIDDRRIPWPTEGHRRETDRHRRIVGARIRQRLPGPAREHAVFHGGIQWRGRRPVWSHRSHPRQSPRSRPPLAFSSLAWIAAPDPRNRCPGHPPGRGGRPDALGRSSDRHAADIGAEPGVEREELRVERA